MSLCIPWGAPPVLIPQSQWWVLEILEMILSVDVSEVEQSLRIVLLLVVVHGVDVCL